MQTVVAAKGHTEVIDVSVSATCTKTGLTEGKHCSECNEIIVPQNTTSVINCIESDWIIDKKPTYTETGNKHKECTMCGTILNTDIIPILIPSEGLEFELNSDGISYSVVGIGSCNDTDLVIPCTYNNLPVTSIGNNAFLNCKSITSVIIFESVKTIDLYAFCGCESLSSIVIYDGLITIENSAFARCISLTSIDIPNTVIEIGDAAFFNCPSLISINLPDSLTSISDYMLGECTSLTSIEIPDNVISIGKSAFNYCISLKNIEIPDNVTTIGAWAFSACYALESITIGNGVKNVDEYAFQTRSFKNINFEGTVKEWQFIAKESGWDSNTGAYTVYCTDGEITKDGTVTYK